MKNSHRSIVLAGAFAVVVAAAYSPAMRSGWVWDDANLVQPSPALQDLAGLRRAVSTDLYRQAAPRLESSPYWRPLALASFWLDTRLGSAPLALHAGNIFLHAAAAAMLAVVLLRRKNGSSLAAPIIATAWWAFHPQNVEAVAWISCRYDLLSGAALIGLLLLPWRPGPWRAAIHGLLFLAGLLSKDGFGAMAAVVAAMDLAESRSPANAAPRWIAIGLAFAAWWAARTALGIASFDLPPPQLLSVLFLDAIRIYSLRQIPQSLSISHPYVPNGILGLAFGFAIFAALILLAVRRRRFAVPVTIFLAGLIPAAVSMAKFGETPERYFYLPSIGLALFIGELIGAADLLHFGRNFIRSPIESSKIKLDWRAGVAASAAIVFGGLAIIGIIKVEARLPEWSSDNSLFAAALRVDPNDAQANMQLGIEAGRRGEWNEASKLLKVAQSSNPDSARIASALAWAMLQSRDIAAALKQAERAAELAPYQPDTWYYLALARHKLGDHSGEHSAIEQILKISADYPGARDAYRISACEMSGRTDCMVMGSR